MMEKSVMWSIVPTGWFSWDCVVQDSTQQTIAELNLSPWRERGAICVGEVEHKISRQGAGVFVLQEGESVLARAEKPGFFSGTFRIEYTEKQYTLESRSVWRRERVLYEEGKEIGTIIPEGAFTRRARAEFPDDMPLVLKLFVVWLTMLLWKRQSDSAAMGASTAFIGAAAGGSS